MTSPNVDALRAELDAAKAVLLPQIRGMHDFVGDSMSLSAATKDQIRQELGEHERRLGVIDQALIALDNLNADGFPETPKREVVHAIIEELRGQMADLQAAVDEFEEPPLASKIALRLGAAVNNPQT